MSLIYFSAKTKIRGQWLIVCRADLGTGRPYAGQSNSFRKSAAFPGDDCGDLWWSLSLLRSNQELQSVATSAEELTLHHDSVRRSGHNTNRASFIFRGSLSSLALGPDNSNQSKGPRPPQPRAATSKRLYRMRAELFAPVHSSARRRIR
jgi:hypothetical protein